MRLHLKTHPNKILNTVCDPIKKIEQKHKRWANSMHYFMKEFGGVGLAAPQVGNPIRLIVINTLKDNSGIKRTMFNPEIIEKSEETKIGQEMCLSLPFKTCNIERSINIKVKYLNTDGNEFVETFNDFDARVILHEIDHLDGILMDNYEKN